MKKASFIILSLSIITITAAAQPAKKHVVKSKAPVAAAQPGFVPSSGKLHSVLITDNDLDLLLNSAANQQGFSGYIMTTATPANQIPQASQYFSGVLQNIVNQRNVWVKAEKDSVAAIKKDTTAKKP